MDDAGLDALAASGATIAPEMLDGRAAGASGRPATIVYTSATTGRSKGCVLTHANLLAEVRNVLLADGIGEQVLTEDSRLLLFLPPAHILTRVVQLAPVRAALFGAAERTAVAFSRALDRERRPGAGLRLRHRVFEALVYPMLRDALRGRVRYAVSGGAPLQPRLGHFCRGVGLTVLEGWGLTETTAGTTLNLPAANRIGTVGRPVPGCGVRIAPDGEVLVRGPNVFAGYWRDHEATDEVLGPDGWLRTGDVGRLDGEYLRIVGRKKDLIVTAGGKNVAPALFEDKLRTHWLVDQCVVVGDNRPYVGALVTLDLEAFAVWKREHRKPLGASVAGLRADADLLATVQAAIDEANRLVSKADAVKRFSILSGQFAVADELTPTQKVRRAHVLAKFAKEIDDLYAAHP